MNPISHNLAHKPWERLYLLTSHRRYADEKSILLIVDAAINLLLGVLLLIYPLPIIKWLGIQISEVHFYPSILGAVLCGIGLALVIECFRSPNGLRGLGLAGAVVINLCGGMALAAWLLMEDLTIPTRGVVLLWSIVIVLLVLSSVEFVTQLSQGGEDRP